MIYLKAFENHSDYETFIAGGGNTPFERPNTSCCKEENEVHFNPKIHDYTKDYLTFEITGGGVIRWACNATASKTIQYSLNEGEWVSITAAKSSYAPSISVSPGDVVRFKGDNNGYSVAINNYAAFSGTTAQFILKGNIMSLISSSNFDTLLDFTASRSFYNIFANCTGLTDASNLQLPATGLTQECYYSMFSGCKSLTTAPELPATALAESCYLWMFSSCTSLTTAPSVLPATTLANSCYGSMFYQCTSLTTAPALPATTLVSSCYYQMFLGCTSLNYIKAMFTTTPDTSYTQNWVSGVAASGTFVKNSSASWNVTGVNGVPTDWTVQTASS